METCLYQGRQICSFDLCNGDMNVEKEWRLAGENGNLTCEECGTVVIVKHGSIKIPHFAHVSVSNHCLYSSYPESEERRTAKKIIYDYLKVCFQPEQVHINVKTVPGVRSDFLIEMPHGRQMVIELLRLKKSTQEWEQKNRIYSINEIMPIWILFDNRATEYSKSLAMFDAVDKILRMINTETGTLSLTKELSYVNPATEKTFKEFFRKDYSLVPPQSANTAIHYDFITAYQEREKGFIKESQEQIKVITEQERQWERQRNEKMTKSSCVETKNSMTSYPMDKWGICVDCGERTNDWYSYDPSTQTCKCNKCYKKRRMESKISRVTEG